jgi:hypothetical protein
VIKLGKKRNIVNDIEQRIQILVEQSTTRTLWNDDDGDAHKTELDPMNHESGGTRMFAWLGSLDLTLERQEAISRIRGAPFTAQAHQENVISLNSLLMPLISLNMLN